MKVEFPHITPRPYRLLPLLCEWGIFGLRLSVDTGGEERGVEGGMPLRLPAPEKAFYRSRYPPAGGRGHRN